MESDKRTGPWDRDDDSSGHDRQCFVLVDRLAREWADGNRWQLPVVERRAENTPFDIKFRE
jgi:hypothetical protein